ncbi:MAG: TRAP transporter small permease [Burkholderiales bacterium]|nr:TRAP transporter small permease [Burkholderiales bacterium]
MKWHEGLMRVCGGIAAAVIGVITVLVCIDVIGRNLGLGSLPWIIDLTEYALPLATLAAAPWLMWGNQHVRLDVLNMVLGAKGQRRMDRTSAAVGLVVSLTMAWYGWLLVLDSKRAGDMVLKALVFPEWWLFAPVPFFFALLAFECARRVLWPATAHSGHATPGDSA